MRLSESQAREVFERAAAEALRGTPPSTEGLTLHELQEIGAAAGLDPAAVTAAAHAVARGEPAEGREDVIGVPVAVSRSAWLDASPSRTLWDHVVADLQETFGAHGRIERREDVWAWRNGNLRASFEPAGTGSRLRIRSHRRDDTPSLLGLGAVAFLLAAVALVASFAASGGLADVLALLAVVLGGSGALDLGLVGGRQLRWARERERQMEGVLKRALHRAGPPTRLGTPSSTPHTLSAALADDVWEEPTDDQGTAQERPRTRV